MHGTPIAQDKRFALCLFTISTVLVMTYLGHPPGEQVLEFLGISLGVFMGQSQAGQTMRARASIQANSDSNDSKVAPEVRHG